MKKLVWSSALALACCSSAAMAEVTLYGRVNLSFDHFDTGADSENRLANNQSRIGARAHQRLSGGIQAYAQLELGVDWAGSDESFVLRDSFGALVTDLGMIRVGYFDTPMRAMGGMADLFGNQLGSARNLTRNNRVPSSDPGGILLRQGFDERVRNSVHYRSPALGDWMLDVHFALEDDESDDPAGGFAPRGTDDPSDFRSLGLSYHAGSLRLGWAQEEHTDRRADRYILRYDGSRFQWTSLYQRAKGPNEKVWGVGLAYQPERTTYRIQHYQLDTGDETLDAELWAVGMDVEINSAFHIYLNYAWVENGSAQALAPYQEGRAGDLRDVETGKNVGGWSLGVSYRF